MSNKEALSEELSVKWKHEADRYTKAVLRGRHPRSFQPHCSELWTFVSESEQRKTRIIQGQLLSQIIDPAIQASNHPWTQHSDLNHVTFGSQSTPQLPSASLCEPNEERLSSPRDTARHLRTPQIKESQLRHGHGSLLGVRLDKHLTVHRQKQRQRRTLKGPWDMSGTTTSGPASGTENNQTAEPVAQVHTQAASDDTELNQAPSSLARQLNTQVDAKLHYGLHVAFQQLPSHVNNHDESEKQEGSRRPNQIEGKFLAVHRRTGQVKVEHVADLSHEYQIVFKVVNLESLENADSVKYHSQIWLQLKPSTPKGGWLDGQVLGIRFHNMTELPTEKIIFDNNENRKSPPNPASRGKRSSLDKSELISMVSQSIDQLLDTSTMPYHTAGNGREASALHREKLISNVLLPIDVGTPEGTVQKQGGIVFNMEGDDGSEAPEEKIKIKDHPSFFKYFDLLKKAGHAKKDIKDQMIHDGQDPEMLDKDPETMISLLSYGLEKDSDLYEKVKLKDHPKYKKFLIMLKDGKSRADVEEQMTKEGADVMMLALDPESLVYLNESKAKSFFTESEQKAKRVKHFGGRNLLNKNALIRARWTIKPINKRLKDEKAEVCNMDEVWLEQDFYYISSQKSVPEACVRRREPQPVHVMHRGEGRHIDRRGVFRVRLADFYVDTAGMTKEQQNVERMMKKAKKQLAEFQQPENPATSSHDSSFRLGGLAHGGVNYANNLRAENIKSSLDSEVDHLHKHGQILKTHRPAAYYGQKNVQIENKLRHIFDEDLKALSVFPDIMEQKSVAPSGSPLTSSSKLMDETCSLPTSFTCSVDKSRLLELSRHSHQTASTFPRVVSLKKQKETAPRPKTTAVLRNYLKTGTFQGLEASSIASNASDDIAPARQGYFASHIGGPDNPCTRCGMCHLWKAGSCLCEEDMKLQDKIVGETTEDLCLETNQTFVTALPSPHQSGFTTSGQYPETSRQQGTTSRTALKSQHSTNVPRPFKKMNSRSISKKNFATGSLGQMSSRSSFEDYQEENCSYDETSHDSRDENQREQTSEIITQGSSAGGKWRAVQGTVSSSSQSRPAPSMFTIASMARVGKKKRGRRPSEPEPILQFSEGWMSKDNRDHLEQLLKDQDTNLINHINYEQEKINASDYQELYTKIYATDPDKKSSLKTVLDHWQGLTDKGKQSVSGAAEAFRQVLIDHSPTLASSLGSIKEDPEENKSIQADKLMRAQTNRTLSDLTHTEELSHHLQSLNISSRRESDAGQSVDSWVSTVDPSVYDHQKTLRCFGNKVEMLNEMLRSFYLICTQKIIPVGVRAIFHKDVQEISKIGDFLIQATECLVAEQLKTTVFDLHQDVQRYLSAKASNSLHRAAMQDLKTQVLISFNHVLVQLKVFLNAINHHDDEFSNSHSK